MSKSERVAKISAPRLFGVVRRSRLFARLDENRGRPLIWIDSPPGSGKTSLVASYLEARSIPAVWCTIDSGDDDPASVFHYLALAVRHLARGGSEALPRFAPEHQSAVADFAQLFFRALYAALPDGAVIVIDNYQELSPACSTHEALLTAVSQVPPGGSIFCISRTPPPPRYAPLRGAGFMCGLDWDSLRFTLDETRELMASRGLTDDRQLRRLHDQADGWAAGITLMIERLGHVELHSGLVPGDAREVTFDYFASLVFDRVPPEYAHVLFHVAFLPYVNAEMASALSGSERAGEVLMDLHRARLFVDKRSGTTAVYVFHALFRDFLQSRAWTRLGTQSTRDLMVRCADVLEASQDPEAAVPLRIATQDWERLSGTLLRLAEEMLVTGRHETLEQWIAALPESERHRQPMLIYWQGVGRAQSALPSGIVLLECALERFDELGDRESQFLCLTALLKFGYAVAYVGLESMDRWTGALLDRLPDENLLDVSPRLELRIWSALCSALMLIRPWHPWVEIAARRVLALLEQGVERAEVVAAATAAFDLAVIRGEINVCERLVVQLKPLLCAPSIPASEVCWAWYQLGYWHLYEAKYEEAWENAERARSVAEKNGLKMQLLQAMLFRTMIEYRAGSWSRASATLQAVEAMPPQPVHAFGRGYLKLLQARRALAAGLLEKAADLAEEAYRLVVLSGSPHLRMSFGLSSGDVLMAAGRLDRATSLLRESREILDESLLLHDSHRAALALAEAFLAHEKGNRSVALQRLDEALMLAQENNRVCFLRYLDVGMQRMFALALARGLHPDFVRKLIEMFRLAPPPNAPSSWPWPIRIFTLGRFEVSVNGQALEFSRKLPRKTLALLKIIIAYGGQNVSETSICDALWPEDEADAAHEALKITVIRLRKLLGIGEAIVHQGGKLALSKERVWVDIWEFERDVTAAEGVRALEALDLYRGQFLPEDVSAPWTVPSRERLRGRFIHGLAAQGAAVEVKSRHEQAQMLYLRGIDADPIVEVFHQGLMRCYQAQGRHLEAISAFRRMRQILSVVLGVAPSPESVRLYEVSAHVSRGDATDEPSDKVIPLPKRTRNSLR